MGNSLEKIKQKVLELQESAAIDSIALDSLPAHVAISKFKMLTEILDFIDSLPKQRNIIDNACQWLEDYADEYACYNATLDEAYIKEDLYEDFRKAMES